MAHILQSTDSMRSFAMTSMSLMLTALHLARVEPFSHGARGELTIRADAGNLLLSKDDDEADALVAHEACRVVGGVRHVARDRVGSHEVLDAHEDARHRGGDTACGDCHRRQ
jgi:hypothetical protein